jgi:transcriptional regulator with XRE-family HTH domain
MNAMKRFRLKKGVTLTDMASRLGVSKPYVAQLESGTRSISAERAEEIADELGIPMEQVFQPVRYRVRD